MFERAVVAVRDTIRDQWSSVLDERESKRHLLQAGLTKVLQVESRLQASVARLEANA